MTPEQIREAAEAYAQKILFTVHIVTDVQISPADLDRVLTAVHAQIVDAWIAGYVVGSTGYNESPYGGRRTSQRRTAP